MRWRVLLLVSLVVNAVLLAAWFVSVHGYSEMAHKLTLDASKPALLVKTNVLVRRQFFSWSEVESSDYPTYIANLREIGCPEQTIRDIIIADVNALYAKRRATELVTPEQQWWRSSPDVAVLRLVVKKSLALEEERRALLTRLLGPSWESGDLASLPRPSRSGVALDGPVLGGLPQDVKQSLEDINVRSEERLQAYLLEAGSNADPAQIAKLRQQTREELAHVLTPPQLEEYLLRYSQNANNLRAQLGRLKYFNSTPDEFRSIFRATDSLDQQLQALAGSTDPNSALQRASLMQQRDQALKQALGDDRYQQFTLLQDPVYQSAYASAQQAGTPDAAGTIYQIDLATAQELASIRANTNLTPQQMAIQLKQTELDQLKASAQATGQYVPPDQPPMPPTTDDSDNNPAPSVRTHPYVLGIAETVASIATRYGVSVGDISAVNPGVNLSRLRPGDSIQVPDTLGP